MNVELGPKTAAATRSPDYPGLEFQPDSVERGRTFQMIRRLLRAQFGRPAGLWGHVVGRIMASRPSNRERSQWTISLLDIQRRDRVLEIGFGPGVAVELASRLATDGLVAGIDHSEVMVRQARRRNAAAVRDGKVVLMLGSVSDLLSFDKPFDKVFTINSIHFWTDPVQRLTELRELLRPGGTIAVTLQPRSHNATDETTRTIGREVVANLVRAGFSDCRLEIRHTTPVAVACALGRR